VSELLLQNVWHLATLDGPGRRLVGADVLVRDGRIAVLRTASDPALPEPSGPRRSIDASRCLALPGLVNTHHHLFQTFTRNLPAVQDAKLFDWLTGLYDVWRHVDAEHVYWSTLLGGAELLLSGCTTTSDHHYLFPASAPEDLLDAQLQAMQRLGLRFHATRGSMSMGRSQGGLPPDDVCQDEDAILHDCERVIDRWHDPSPGSRCRIALAPCAPFNVTPELMRQTIRLARRRGVRVHTHLAETEDENAFCQEHFGKRPLQLMEDLEWLGDDVWFAHGVTFEDHELDRLAATGTGISHCPSSNMRLGSGIARVPEMLRRGVPVGLGVDGSSSNDTSDMLAEVRQALLLSRVRHGADALSAEAVLRLATSGSARLLGRQQEIGSLEIGKLADIVLVDLDRIDLAGSLSDPMAAVVFSGMQHRVRTVIVHGDILVDEGHLVGVDEEEITRKAQQLSFRLLDKAGVRLPWGTPPWIDERKQHDA
jgi:cytosine/adenosine deaminase-related metal-dependent hydrolase